MDYEQKFTIKTSNPTTHPKTGNAPNPTTAETSISGRSCERVSAKIGGENQRYGQAAAPEIITFHRHLYEQRTASKVRRTNRACGDRKIRPRQGIARFSCCPAKRQAIYQRSGQRISKTNSGPKDIRHGSTPTPKRIADCEQGQKTWQQKTVLQSDAARKIQEGSQRNQGGIGKLFQFKGETATAKDTGERYCCAATTKGVN